METKNEISKIQECILIRAGIEIWVDEDKAVQIKKDLLQGITNNFIKAGNRIINVKEVVGIFNPDDLEDLKRRKNGQWKCEYGEWHNRGDICECHKKKIEKDKQNKLNAQLAGDDVSEEQRIKNLDKFRGMKGKIFNKSN